MNESINQFGRINEKARHNYLPAFIFEGMRTDSVELELTGEDVPYMAFCNDRISKVACELCER